MNKPPEFEIDEPKVVDDQGRSPNKEEVTDPDVRKIESGTNLPGGQGTSNHPQDEQDEDATDGAISHDGRPEDDRESEDDLSASDKGEAGDLGRDAGGTQGSQRDRLGDPQARTRIGASTKINVRDRSPALTARPRAAKPITNSARTPGTPTEIPWTRRGSTSTPSQGL